MSITEMLRPENFPIDQGKLTKFAADIGYALACFSMESKGQNLISFLYRFGSGNLEAFNRLEVKKIERTSPIVDCMIFSGMVTGGTGIRCCLLMESRTLHVVYFKYLIRNSMVGFIKQNMAIPHLPADAEVTHFFQSSLRSVVIYGWDLCRELTVRF